VILPRSGGEAIVRPVTNGAPRTVPFKGSGYAVLRMTGGTATTSGALEFQSATADAVELGARAIAEGIDPAALGTVRLAAPFQIESVLGGITGRIGDFVTDEGGTLFLATSDGFATTPSPGAGTDVVIRLTPLPR